MAGPNERLRAARERMESPRTPGQSMTRQELADLVNAQVYRTEWRRSSLDANHVGKWERGCVWWPAAHYRAALRVVLDVATDAELGFSRTQHAHTEDVDRKTFLKTTLGAGAGWAVSRAVPPVLSDRDELATVIAGPTAQYRQMEAAVSSEQLAPAVEAHLRLSTQIVRRQLRTSGGYQVLSEIAGLSAWLAADRGDLATARQRYADGVRYAESSAHPLLVPYMTASFGHFAVESGDPAHGLRLLTKASRQLDASAPYAARAWLNSLHAVAYSAIRDRAATLDALRQAERFSDHADEPRWPWVFAFDAAKAARYQAQALGQLGDLWAAHTAYTTAAPSLRSPKPRALADVAHAQVLAGSGQLAEACALAATAVHTAHTYGSERIIGKVRHLRAELPAQSRDVQGLDDALAELYEDPS